MKFIKLLTTVSGKTTHIILNTNSIVYIKGNEDFTIVVCNNKECIEVLDSIESIYKQIEKNELR